jgi:Tol biopolymer transport system component
MRAKGLVSAGLLTGALLLASCTWFQPPVLPVGLAPTAGAVNTIVTVTGTGFGATQGTSVVTFDGAQAPIVVWADTAIEARVPVLPTPDGERGIVVNVVRGGTVIGTCLFTLQRGILFETNRDGNSEIYMMNPDGSNPTNLTSHPATDYSAAWSPDGTRIAFVTGRDGDAEIYVMDADGSGATNLSRHPDDDTFPVWSPTGTHIAFQTDRESTGPILSVDPKIILGDFNIEIFVMNDDGTGQINVSNDPAWDGFPSWSQDGDQIVFESDRDETDGIVLLGLDLIIDGMGHEIYRVDIDGSDLVNLTNSPEDDGRPVWSPAAEKVVFVSDRDGNAEIYTMNADGSGQMRLTNNLAYDTYPSWSPDGGWITFHSDRDGNTEIYKMTEAGLSTTRLTTSPDWDWGPSWSPDGDAIAFQSSRDGNAEIYRMTPTGASQQRLTNDPDWDLHPVWGTPTWLPPA